MPKIELYTSHTCTNCMHVKEMLKDKGLSYEEKDIAVVDNRKELMSLGYTSLPVLKVGETIIAGFNLTEIKALLEDVK